MADYRSQEAQAYRHLYHSRRWRRMRAAQLTAEPLCRFCRDRDDVTVATVADHIKPHRGDEALFWDPSNLQSLCAPCHDRDKALIEAGRTVVAFGADGWPVSLSG